MKFSIRLTYLYLFAFVGLLTVVIGSVKLADLLMRMVVFKDADRYEYSVPALEEGPKFRQDEMRRNAIREQNRARQRELSNSLAMIVVGLPLYLYHWAIIRKENRK